MNTTVTGPDGKQVYPEMGSYGIGVSRLVGAVIEASHDDAGIIWPDAIAPFTGGHPEPEESATRPAMRCASSCTPLSPATRCTMTGRTAPGVKFADADLMGHPWQIVVGPRGAASGKVELKRRATGSGRSCLSRMRWRRWGRGRNAA